MKPVPSIRGRLANALLLWALVWGAAVGAAVWLAASREVDELLDETLQSSAGLLAAIAADASAGAAPSGPEATVAAGAEVHFAWQVLTADGSLQMRSPRAPDVPWVHTRSAGFSDTEGWRLYGLSLGADGRMFYAAQTRAERAEARMETALGAVLAALAVGLLGHVWLRWLVRRELEPLQGMSTRLQALDLDTTEPDAGAVARALGRAERQELQTVHAALEGLMARLAARVATERAISAHAAHALRTPLAGIDAQLAVALRDCPPALSARLQRVRDAAGRLQGVVAALLGLFRSGGGVQRAPVDLATLLSRLPAAGLQVEVDPDSCTDVEVDADLLAAALVNLLDNALRHGARHVTVALTDQNSLRLSDDGPGISASRRALLQAAIDAQAYEGHTGLGLMLADRVARAHGGGLHLPASDRGFVVELDLGLRPGFRPPSGATAMLRDASPSEPPTATVAAVHAIDANPHADAKPPS
jgi:signal transduction histidine kinase